MTVVVSDIATALGQEPPTQGTTTYEQWNMWIADAVMLIGAEAKRRGVDVATLDETTVDYVTREAVVAQVRRPDDATSVEIAVDDGREARRYSSSRGRVTILPEWWGLLFPTALKSGKAYAVDTVAGPCAVHADVCSANQYANVPHWYAGFCTCGADIAGFPLYETEGS